MRDVRTTAEREGAEEWRAAVAHEVNAKVRLSGCPSAARPFVREACLTRATVKNKRFVTRNERHARRVGIPHPLARGLARSGSPGRLPHARKALPNLRLGKAVVLSATFGNLD